MRDGKLLALDTPSALKRTALPGVAWEFRATPLLAALSALESCPAVLRAGLVGDHLRAISASGEDVAVIKADIAVRWRRGRDAGNRRADAGGCFSGISKLIPGLLPAKTTACPEAYSPPMTDNVRSISSSSLPYLPSAKPVAGFAGVTKGKKEERQKRRGTTIVEWEMEHGWRWIRGGGRRRFLGDHEIKIAQMFEKVKGGFPG